MVRFLASRQKEVDYRLLVAAAYLGLGCTWHAGLSASAPILVATPGHFLEKQIGIIPMSQTVFSHFNLILVGVIFIFLCIFVPLLHPPKEKTVTADLKKLLVRNEEEITSSFPEKTTGFISFLENSALLGIIFGSLGLGWTVWYLVSHKLALNLNVLNFGILFLGVLLHLKPSSFLKAAEEGGKLVFGIS